ncbi:MAG: hypothetical protein M0Z38_05270, partial [Deltaproteobacteria bacterium]|nr:hypothetical protein [Deltaproteobacteria bacterium]
VPDPDPVPFQPWRMLLELSLAHPWTPSERSLARYWPYSLVGGSPAPSPAPGSPPGSPPPLPPDRAAMQGSLR